VDLSNQPVCLLTGASGTLGTALCARMTSSHRIAGVHLDREIRADTQHAWAVDPLAEPTDPHKPPDHAVFAIRADLRERADVDRVVELTLARFGHIDVVINAAGLAVWGEVLASQDLVARAHEQLTVNVLAPLWMVAAIVDRSWRHQPNENRRRNRSVVNVSSTAGVWVHRGRGQSVYAASKSAQNTLSLHLADELATIGVRVNSVAPDSFPEAVPTELVASAIAQLADARESGQLIVVDRTGINAI